jgi:hypothetical protein
MPQRKHITEIALGFFSTYLVVLHPKNIADVDSQPEHAGIAENCHIYLIVKRPRVAYVPDSIVVGDESTVGRFRYVREGIAAETEFFLRGKPNADELRISPYPHHKLTLVKDGEEYTTIPAHLMCLMCDGVADPAIRDLEVAYVGMSYAEGRRSAKDRLLSHSTLQQVLADLNSDAPDDEALIIMAQFDSPQTFISFDGRDKSLKLEDDRDVMADLAKQQELVTEDLQIALIEAGLIRYFQPLYNDKYKQRFPHPTQKILDALYKIDFGALTVEINTEEINSRIFSSVRKPGYHHIASYDLHDPTVRHSFFNTMNAENGSDAEDHSGPVF